MLGESIPRKELPHLEILERAAKERVRMNQETAATVQPNPQRGKGDKDQECSHYRRCLDLAAVNDWPAFHCEDCEYALTGGPSIDDADRDELEEEAPDDLKPTRGEGDQCADCTWLDECYQYAANKGWPDFHCGECPYNPEAEETAPDIEEAGESEENNRPEDHDLKSKLVPEIYDALIGKDSEPKEPPKSPPKAASAPTLGQDENRHAQLSIPYGGYARLDFTLFPYGVEILRRISEIADEEVRSFEGQVVYFLKKALEDRGLLSKEPLKKWESIAPRRGRK